MLGGSSPGTAGPALVPLPLESIPDAIPAPPALPRPAPELVERVRHHPYVRLALNSSFAALWTGQLISLFGDRLHQVALAVLVLITTGSALAAGFVFLVATLPNVLFGPFAGTLVDRWEHKEVMIVSDLLRAAVILLIPIAVAINVLLVYPLVFIVTTISIFFRPARVAILPRIVDEDDLLTANSALWIAEVSADVIGYPAGGRVRRRPRHGPAARVLDRRRHLCRLGGAADGRHRAAARSGAAGRGAPQLHRRAGGRLALPAQRADALRQHDPGHDRSDHDRRHDRPVGRLRGAGPRWQLRLRLQRDLRLPRNRHRAGQPDRRVRDRPDRRALREGPDDHRRVHRDGPRACSCSGSPRSCRRPLR